MSEKGNRLHWRDAHALEEAVARLELVQRTIGEVLGRPGTWSKSDSVGLTIGGTPAAIAIYRDGACESLRFVRYEWTPSDARELVRWLADSYLIPADLLERLAARTRAWEAQQAAAREANQRQQAQR